MLATQVGQATDYVVIVAYFALVLGFGTFFGRFSKSTRDFFFSGQKFSWWLIAMSMAATGVGSYSFIKYSQKGFEYGLSSSMTYMNDWFAIPFFMFGWLPIIYFSRTRSIPEYFQRRFNTTARLVAVVIIIQYMVGYIGFNFFTLGKVAEQLLGINIYTAITIIAVISAIYISFGGQTAVIFTDLLQGFMLFAAGALLLLLGLNHLGQGAGILAGLENFWRHLSLEQRLPFARFNEPQDFNFVGVFWQDGVGSLTFLFINQGLIMRFLAAKSMTEGRKTILFNTLFMLPLSVIVVANAGWVGRAMVSMGLLPADLDPHEAFVQVAALVTQPEVVGIAGVFGFVLAALTAALMSTIDTLTNATAAVLVYDVYQPFVRKNAADRTYLRAARWASVITSVVGLLLGWYFAKHGTDMYKTHARFLSMVTPPIVVAVFLGAFWRRFTSAGALSAMLGGTGMIWLGTVYPKLVQPFAMVYGIKPDGDGQYSYMLAFYGLVVSGAIGIVVSLRTRPKPEHEIAGLWVGSIHLGQRFFKGGHANHERGRPTRGTIVRTADGTAADAGEGLRDAEAPSHQPMVAYPTVRLSHDDMERLRARPGDLLYIVDGRPWLGGLRSLHARAGQAHNTPGAVHMSETAFDQGSFLPDRPVRVEKLL